MTGSHKISMDCQTIQVLEIKCQKSPILSREEREREIKKVDGERKTQYGEETCVSQHVMRGTSVIWTKSTYLCSSAVSAAWLSACA